MYDVIIIGGGPGGLSAALTLGRARKRVALFDAGPRRNAAAIHIHNFVTRDGTVPDDFRRIAREQLGEYPSVEVRDLAVRAIEGTKGAFRVESTEGAFDTRRVLLSTGMVDETIEIDGFRELWGRSIFQCPYCHGWEVRDRPWGVLADPKDAHMLPFALLTRGWTDELVVFTDGDRVSEEAQVAFRKVGIQLETEKVSRLIASDDGYLTSLELAGGRRVRCEVLYAHPPQHQVELVRGLGLDLDEQGYVRVDEMGQTSTPGIYAAGDLTTRMQAAIAAAAAGMRAGAAINVDLMMARAA